MIVIYILIPIIILGVAGFVVYTRYRATPVSQWAILVRSRWNELDRKLRTLAKANATPLNTESIAKPLFDQNLRNLPVDGVIEFPGIGPVTVERLKEAGLRSIRDLMGYEFQRIPGFGPVKSRDLRSAVQQIVQNARSRFDAGLGEEGQEYKRQIAEIELRDKAEREARRQTIANVQSVMAQIKPLADVAHQVTFVNHLLKKPVPGLTEELMKTGLLDVPRDVIVTVTRSQPKPVTPVPPTVPIPTNSPMVAEKSARSANPTEAPAVSTPPAPSKTSTNSDLFEDSLRNSNPINTDDPASSTSTNPQLAKLRTLAQLGMLFARADGRIARTERARIREFLVDRFGSDALILRHVDPQIEQAESAKIDETTLIKLLKQSSSQQELKSYYQFAHDVFDAAGEKNDRELAMLQRLAESWSISVVHDTVTEAQPKQEPTRTVDTPDPRKVLEIEPGVDLTPELIRRRFTLLTEKNDPAKVAQMSAEIIAQVERKRREIREAAESLIAGFGVALELAPEPPPPSDIRHNPDLDDVFGQ